MNHERKRGLAMTLIVACLSAMSVPVIPRPEREKTYGRGFAKANKKKRGKSRRRR